MWILTAVLVILLDDIRVVGQSSSLYGKVFTKENQGAE